MRRSLNLIPTALCAAVLFTAFISCTEEEITPRQAEAPVAEVPVFQGSMTITGLYTTYRDVADCKTCTYVVPDDVTIVDGDALKLKPGAIVCLDAARKYGDLEFVNLKGTEEKPITIGTARFN